MGEAHQETLAGNEQGTGKLALGKLTPGRRRGIKGSASKTSKSKEVGSNQTGKVKDIRKYFEEKVGSCSSNQEIGSKEEGRNGSDEPDLEPKPGSGKFQRKEPTGKQ